MDKEEEYIRLLKILFEVGEANKGTPAGDDDRILDAEGLFLKFFVHAASLLYLSRSTILSEVGAGFFDSASINVIGRAAMETFLTFHHIFIAPASDEDRNLRYLTWQLSGLLERQSYTIKSLEGTKKLGEELDYINSLKDQIKKNQSFKELDARLEKKILKGKWRLDKSWKDIGISAGFSKRNSKEFYSYLCEYAHSGNLSVLQFRQADNAESQKRLFASTMNFVMIAMANMIQSYCMYFPKCKCVLTQRKDDVMIIDKWIYIGSN